MPATNEFIEIKGQFSDSDKLKISLVEEYNNIKIKVIFRSDMIELGLLTRWYISGIIAQLVRAND